MYRPAVLLFLKQSNSSQKEKPNFPKSMIRKALLTIGTVNFFKFLRYWTTEKDTNPVLAKLSL